MAPSVNKFYVNGFDKSNPYSFSLFRGYICHCLVAYSLKLNLRSFSLQFQLQMILLLL